MRCYFMKAGHIAAVELLPKDTDDQDAIVAGKKLFLARIRDGFEGFEIWDQKRLVFRYPDTDETGEHAPRNGQSGRGDSSGRGKKALQPWMRKEKAPPLSSVRGR